MQQSAPDQSDPLFLRGSEAEEHVAQLYRALGYTVHRGALIGPIEVDLLLERNGEREAVEVISGPIGVDRLRVNIARLLTLRALEPPVVRPTIVITSQPSAAARHWMQHQTDVRIRLLADLQAEVDGYIAQQGMRETPAGYEAESDVQARLAASRDEIRSALIERLDAHASGRQTLSWVQYEQLCLEVFTFLFDPTLYGFERQRETTDGGNRYDFICRIAPGRAFWDTLRADFRTRALLVECKNYSDPITADQIYSTERYLFARALRTVCFLVARVGGDAGCMRAAQGAMRESGKLILVLSNQNLIEMLVLGENRDGVEGYLDDRIWEFIVTLPR